MTNKTDSGFEECMAITRTLMRVIGVWPFDVVWPNCKLLTLMLPLFFSNILPQTAIESRDNFSLMLDAISTVDINGFIAFIKTLTLWYYRVEMKTLVVQIQRDWETTSAEEHRDMWLNARTSMWILRFFTVSSFGTIIMYTVVYFVSYESNFVQANGTTFRPLHLESFFPLQAHESPVYEIIRIGQFVGASVIGFAAYDELYVSSISHYNEQIFNLKQRMQNLVVEKWLTENLVVRCLRPVIQRHLHLVSCVHIIEDSFNKTFFVQVFVLFITLCFQGYQSVTKPFSEIDAGNALLIFTIFLAANLGSIFFAQIIPDETLSLLGGIYQVQWNKLSTKDGITIVMIVMNRCIRPIELTVSPLTLEYFAPIMKKFVKYLSALLAVKNSVVD